MRKLSAAATRRLVCHATERDRCGILRTRDRHQGLLYNLFGLLWPPLEGEIRNPERFVMMFAPISRTYREPFYSDRYEAPPEYYRNQNEMPRSVAANLGFYRAWDEVGRGDSLIFDYHYMWAHYRDIGGVRIATILGEDINNLDSLNFNGYMSCQVQRAMAPNAMGFTVMARTLWERPIPPQL